MDALVYSLNATVPVFLVILSGYLFRKVGTVNEGFINAANRLNYKVTLPSLLLLDMMKMDLRSSFDVKYILFCAIVTTISFWGIWGISKLVIKDKSIIGAFVQGSFRSSAAVLGTAFIINIFGNSECAPIMMIGCVPLYNIYSVIVLSVEANSEQEKSLKSICKDIIQNPILVGIMTGTILSFCNVKFPHIVETTIENYARLATPLALIAIGAGFNIKNALNKMKPALVATMIKLVLLPAIFLPMAVALGYTGAKLICVLIMLGSPTTPSCYIMAKSMDNDEVVTSSIIVLTTLLSAFSITVFMFILKYNGLV